MVHVSDTKYRLAVSDPSVQSLGCLSRISLIPGTGPALRVRTPSSSAGILCPKGTRRPFRRRAGCKGGRPENKGMNAY